MPEIGILNSEGQEVGTMSLDDAVFGVPAKPHVVQQVVRYQLAHGKMRTAKTKTRTEVRGGGRKPWRQKGTGRARAGTIRSPLWRGGGITFGPIPKDLSIRLPKKVRKLALKVVLSDKLRNQQFKVIEKIELPAPKTREMGSFLKKLELAEDTILIITTGGNQPLERASRNLPKVKLLKKEGLNVYDILKFKNLLFTREAVEYVQEVLQP
ncbi:MAG: 50S ribosomal protein L4 [bacterium]|jgi:large subunit ribosomal protein L4|nr:50S ribosomal protein L4 [bacterium]